MADKAKAKWRKCTDCGLSTKAARKGMCPACHHDYEQSKSNALHWSMATGDIPQQSPELRAAYYSDSEQYA